VPSNPSCFGGIAIGDTACSGGPQFAASVVIVEACAGDPRDVTDAWLAGEPRPVICAAIADNLAGTPSKKSIMV